LLFEKNLSEQHIKHQEILSATGNLNEAAKNLYAAMHRLDHSNLDIIVAERLPDIGLGKTINDKLERASKKE
jgi:L-threonylcarbamoyladenylate synthase